MESDKDMFKVFNEFIFLDQSDGCVDVKINVLRNYIINRFHNTIPQTRKITTLSLIDDIVLKLHDKNLEGIQDDMYSVRENVMYMLFFENLLMKMRFVMKTMMIMIVKTNKCHRKIHHYLKLRIPIMLRHFF